MTRLHWLWATAASLIWLPARGVEDPDFFERRVRPLLVERCYKCHSAGEKIKGGLRLDTRDGWATGGDSGPAIQPGKPDESLLVKAVGYTDRDLKMPPKQRLPDAEIAVLKQWVAMGAPDPRAESPSSAGPTESPNKPKVADAKTWWAFQPIRKVNPPDVRDKTWPRNAIDRFILARLETKGLRPSPDAAPETLLRRLHYDLTGLPPAGEDRETSPRSPSPGLRVSAASSAEPLLASPQFAERFASHWLDLVRFAESSGGGRTLPFKDAWRYRDYVISSFNANVPLDRFLAQQVAGDLLPYQNAAERRDNLTATAFLVLGPTNYEEQDKVALRMDIVDEQLDTLGKSFLGLTIGCARCHDHKFDPIPTRDYYALAGILRSTRVIKDPKENVAHWIDTPLPMDEPLESELRSKETRLASLKLELDKTKTALKKAGVASALKNLKPGPLPVAELPGIVVDDSEAKLIGNWKHSTVFKTFIGQGYISDQNRDKGSLTATFQPRMIEAGRYEVRLAYIASSDRETKVPVTILHADGETTVKVDQTEPPPIDGRWVSLGTYRFEANGEGYVLISNTETTDFVTADAVQFLKTDDKAVAEVGGAKRSKVSKKNGTARNDDLSALEKEIKSMETTGPQRPEAMAVRDEDSIEDCPIHVRGQVRNLGEKIPRGFLTAFHVPPGEALPADQSGRVQLARWLVSPQNPLTARVLANRIWLWLVGEGLVRTPDNFGSTGEKPSHPELLDYLASELIESGWDLRHLVKLIVDSRTYQMSSTFPPSAARHATSIDPDNRLLWRANRKRLDAEEIRDTILLASGALRTEVGGANMRDAKAVDANDAKAANIEYGFQFTDTRRSLYTPAFRNVRHPLFEVFDFADINQPVGRRSTSTVATQELFLLNHPFVIEQARLAATRLLGASDRDDEARIRRLYVRILGRAPSPGEMNHVLSFLDASVSGNATSDELRDVWARLVQALFATPDFRFLE